MKREKNTVIIQIYKEKKNHFIIVQFQTDAYRQFWGILLQNAK